MLFPSVSGSLSAALIPCGDRRVFGHSSVLVLFIAP